MPYLSGLALVIHGWDIARATGLDETLPADEIARVREDAVGLGDNLHIDWVCGPPVEVADDASAQNKLLALLGRRP